MKTTILMTLLLICTLNLNSQTADSISQLDSCHYIRNGAAGSNNGADWANAWTTLPDTLVRGHTYYIADGNYSGYAFDDAVDGEKYIYIKKATVNSHGANTGWDDSYSDGQAIFTHSVSFDTGYWIWDGTTGTGKNEASYGFRIRPKSDSDSDTHHQMIRMVNPVSNIGIQHTSMVNWGSIVNSAQTAIYSLEGTNITIANNYMCDHGATMLIRNWNNCLIENNYFVSNWSSLAHHGEHISTSGDTNIICRNNVFDGNAGSGVIHVVTGTSSDWDLYGNVFINGSTGRPTISAGGADAFSNLRVYNNTFINLTHAGVHGSNGSGNIAFNNLFYNCPVAYFASCGHYNNWFYDCGDNWEPEVNSQVGSGDPFVDYLNGDFHLSGATNAGINLGTPYNIDPEGITRGADGVWDRGALEYQDPKGDNNHDNIPSVYALYQNYPNPFNPSTKINYFVSTKENIKLVIYDLLGRQIRTLINGMVTAGPQSVTWDGRDTQGKTVSSGVYFYQLRSETGFTKTQKMILLN